MYFTQFSKDLLYDDVLHWYVCYMRNKKGVNEYHERALRIKYQALGQSTGKKLLKLKNSFFVHFQVFWVCSETQSFFVSYLPKFEPSAHGKTSPMSKWRWIRDENSLFLNVNISDFSLPLTTISSTRSTQWQAESCWSIQFEKNEFSSLIYLNFAVCGNSDNT